MASESTWAKLKNLDAYAKPLEDFRIKTVFGGTVTIVSSIIMVLLFVSELRYYLAVEIQSDLIVDMLRNPKISIYFDVTFPQMACSYLTLDAMDVSGSSQSDIVDNVFKRRLNLEGEVLEQEGQRHKVNEESTTAAADVGDPPKPTLDPNRCESCFGAEAPDRKCCNTCSAVREAYRKKGWAVVDPQKFEQCRREGFDGTASSQIREGCEVYGHVEVNKVAGNIHIAPGKTFKHSHAHVHDMQEMSGMQFNTTHFFRYVAFGGYFPGMQNPLDDTVHLDDEFGRMFQYYIQIVPTLYQHIDDDVPTETNQYSVTWHAKQTGGLFGDGLPGVFIQYEFSPMMVKVTEKRRSFTHFLTSVCAIIGGVFTVAGLLDALFFTGSRIIREKMEMGKLG